MLEPRNNPNSSLMVDPPGLLRYVISWRMGPVTSTEGQKKARDRFEADRRRRQDVHRVHYFHQLDDPYSHLTAQVLARFAARYDVTIEPHLIRATGGANQPEMAKLAALARRDAALIAPHLGLTFPDIASEVPGTDRVALAARILAGLSPQDFIEQCEAISHALWAGADLPSPKAGAQPVSPEAADQALDQGSALLKELGHYSGATFFYGGEWYWGVDRLFHLELRLQELDLCREQDAPFIAPRPAIDTQGVDASHLTLDFFPSLNSPYTSIIYDRTIDLVETCGIRLNHKPVLPMIMRGVPATFAKGRYILFDTKREADYFGVSFGKIITPIGTPTRQAYSLLPWAAEQGKDIPLMSSLLRHAFAEGVALHKESGMRRAVEAAGLNWKEAKTVLGTEEWKPIVAGNQKEMVEDLGLWGVPSYRLSGPDGEPDLAVWGQDRLWLVAAEIRRRSEMDLK